MLTSIISGLVAFAKLIPLFQELLDLVVQAHQEQEKKSNAKVLSDANSRADAAVDSLRNNPTNSAGRTDTQAGLPASSQSSTGMDTGGSPQGQ